jgi:hypothetical protein
MDRASLVPPGKRLERLFLLDLLGQRVHDLPAALDADAFLGVTPENLYAFVHSQLSKIRDTPAALLNKTAPHYRRNVMLELRRAADLRRLDATLTTAGIPYLVLKGPILAHTAYRDPATRTMLDLDLLLRDADLERAMAALAAIGYSVPEHFAGWELNAGDAPPMIDNTSGSAVLELHTMLDSIPHDDPPLDAVWARTRRVAVGHGLELPTLDDAEFFIHVVMHVSRHHRFEGELRSLLDVDLLLRSGQSTLDWKALDDECQCRGISEWIVLTIALAEILLGSPVPDIYKNRHPSPEALSIAAEQLWATDEHFVPTRITQRLAGAAPAPMFHGTGMKVEAPSGLRFRAHREWKRVRNAITALRTGGLRPRNVAKSVDLYVKRERLFALLENERPLR